MRSEPGPRARRRWAVAALTVALLGALGAALPARADAVKALRDFVREVRSGRAEFTQTVIAPDGARRRSASGQFEFQRPNRFRFSYAKPFEQLIVADGQKVWVHDPGLNQVTSRRLGQALGATPAALLAGGTLEPDFTLSPLPAAEGLEWALATPRNASRGDSTIESLRVGFRGGELAVLEIVDGFGQRSRLVFSKFAANVEMPADRFRFTPPAGADVVEQ